MAVARRTVELGRAARSQAKVKVRQPLREAVVVADERERARDRAARGAGARRAEREGRSPTSSEAEELADYEVKPNFRTLGPRFGARMREAAAAIAALDPAARRGRLRPRRARRRSTSTASEEALGADDLSLVMLPREGYQLERQANYAVALQARPRRRAACARASRARSCTRSRTRARAPASRSRTGSSWRFAATSGLLERRAPARRLRRRRDARRAACSSTARALDGAHTETARIDGSELEIALRRARLDRLAAGSLASPASAASGLRRRASGRGELDASPSCGARGRPRSPCTQVSSVRITIGGDDRHRDEQADDPEQAARRPRTPIAITRRMQPRRARHHQRDDHVALDLLHERRRRSAPPAPCRARS